VRQLTAALAVASICILTAGCSSGGNQGAKTSTTRSTTTTTTAPPLADTALPALLLSPEQVNTAMAATEMTVTKTHFEMSDDSAAMEPKECLAIDGSAQAQVYAGSGYSAEREQTLQEGDNFTHYVQQAVVLFPSANQAGAFFTASAQQRPACRQYTHTQSGSLWDVGPISNTNSTLSTTATQQNANAPGWACGRALAHRTTSLSTSTPAVPTPRTPLSTSPTRSPPKCLLNVPPVGRRLIGPRCTFDHSNRRSLAPQSGRRGHLVGSDRRTTLGAIRALPSHTELAPST